MTLVALVVLSLTPSKLDSAAAGVQLEMKNVRLHVDEGIVFDVRHLRGTMVSTSAGPPVFDDGRSYTIRLQSAEMSMEMTSLQALLNHHVFAFEGAPVKDLEVSAEEGRIKLTGKLHKGIDVPFSTKTSVSATPEGLLQLHVDSMKAIGIPAKGLLGLFGLELDDVMKIKNRRGIDVRDNDIVIAAGQVLPPPRIDGRLRRVAVEGTRLVQIFDSGRPGRRLTPPSPGSRNYVYFGGGNIRFGKLTMHGADLQLIDMDTRDTFDFYPAKYHAQLVAGSSKNTPAKGLKTFMPDYDDLQRAAHR